MWCVDASPGAVRVTTAAPCRSAARGRLWHASRRRLLLSACSVCGRVDCCLVLWLSSVGVIGGGVQHVRRALGPWLPPFWRRCRERGSVRERACSGGEGAACVWAQGCDGARPAWEGRVRGEREGWGLRVRAVLCGLYVRVWRWWCEPLVFVFARLFCARFVLC